MNSNQGVSIYYIVSKRVKVTCGLLNGKDFHQMEGCERGPRFMEAFVRRAVFRRIRHDHIRLVETEALGGSLARRGVERQVTEEADQSRTGGR